MATKREHANGLDRLGAYASTLCAVHCVITGVAFGLLSVGWLAFLHNPWLEGSFLGIALVVGILAAWHGHRKHGSLRPAGIFVLGLTLIVVGHFAFANHEESMLSALMSAGGGMCLVGFHILNQRMGSCHRHDGHLSTKG